MSITFTMKGGAIQKEDLETMRTDVRRCHTALHEKTGKGNDFVGWVHWPTAYDKEEFARIKAAAKKFRARRMFLL